jgi:hypothetical protein
MIITALNGGLGNQLFQYAAGLSLASRHQVPLKIDPQFKTTDTSRTLGLSHFNIRLQEATKEEIHQLYPSSSFTRAIQRLLPTPFKHFYKEKKFAYQDTFEKLGASVYLKGYWQSEKYFSGITDQLRETLKLNPIYFQALHALIQELTQTDSVAIHVRKGDYLKQPYSDYYATIDSTYYNTALSALENISRQLKLYVFTDDPDWVNNQLHLTMPFILVSGVHTKNMYEDFEAMRSCKYHIIANSSFSWWTAWLSDREDKQVIAPKQWFKNGPSDTYDLLPKSWLIL